MIFDYQAEILILKLMSFPGIGNDTLLDLFLKEMIYMLEKFNI